MVVCYMYNYPEALEVEEKEMGQEYKLSKRIINPLISNQKGKIYYLIHYKIVYFHIHIFLAYIMIFQKVNIMIL